jgi:hypothetical protein
MLFSLLFLEFTKSGIQKMQKSVNEKAFAYKKTVSKLVLLGVRKNIQQNQRRPFI